MEQSKRYFLQVTCYSDSYYSLVTQVVRGDHNKAVANIEAEPL